MDKSLGNPRLDISLIISLAPRQLDPLTFTNSALVEILIRPTWKYQFGFLENDNFDYLENEKFGRSDNVNLALLKATI